MKILLISTHSLPASPTGLAYVAGALRAAGHEVAVFERLFAADPPGELTARLGEFRPDVVGVSIRLVFGDVLDANAPLGTRHIDLRPQVKQLVDVVQQHSRALIVLGGPGFNYYARHWLEYLGVEYGIRGEGEEAFPRFLQSWAKGEDVSAIPGCVVYRDGRYQHSDPQPVANLDATPLPAYDLLDFARYTGQKVLPAIFTRRGCAFDCLYCPYSKLEGKHYRLKSAQRVLTEAEHVLRHTGGKRILFVDNNFNAPPAHAAALCRAMIAAHADFEWGTGDLRPVGITPDFCNLMADSGCFYANLSIESACDSMLTRMRRGYTVRQVRAALETLGRSRLPFGASLMLGAPGETPETIAETLDVLDEYDIPLGVWVTIGVYLWTDYQDIVAEARQAGLLNDEGQLFRGAVYYSPGLPPAYLAELPQALRARPGYSVQFNKPHEDWTLAAL